MATAVPVAHPSTHHPFTPVNQEQSPYPTPNHGINDHPFHTDPDSLPKTPRQSCHRCHNKHLKCSRKAGQDRCEQCIQAGLTCGPTASPCSSTVGGLRDHQTPPPQLTRGQQSQKSLNEVQSAPIQPAPVQPASPPTNAMPRAGRKRDRLFEENPNSPDLRRVEAEETKLIQQKLNWDAEKKEAVEKISSEIEALEQKRKAISSKIEVLEQQKKAKEGSYNHELSKLEEQIQEKNQYRLVRPQPIFLSPFSADSRQIIKTEHMKKKLRLF